jgi:membrane-associated protease RseP (regulator of RpoE activity)
MYRLSTAAVDLCGDKVAGVIGMTMMSARSFSGEYETIARSEFGYDDGLTVTAVMEGSPADYGGLLPGDRLVSINGTAIAATRRDNDRLQTALKQGAGAEQPLTMVVRRQGATQTLTITPVTACYYQSRITTDEFSNAFADGEQVYVTKGMMNFVKSEEELALVLSHEISHNALDHIEKKEQNRLVGALAGAVVDIVIAVTAGVSSSDFTRAGAAVGARAYSVQFEQEADYQALYIMRRAGYSIADAANFWRRVGAESPEQITLRNTHPTTAERFVAITKAVDEVSAKEAQGIALLPNTRSGQPATQYAFASRSPTPERTFSAAPGPSVATLMPQRRVPSGPLQALPAEKPNLGVRGGTVTRNQSGPSLYLPDPYGAWIDDVNRGGPAERAGIRRADIIRTFNGHRVETFEELEAYAAETIAGTRVRLGVFRNREMITIEVDL